MITFEEISGLSQNVIKSIGPGILLAGAAIGVSHLVQSTRAGAEFGYILLPALLIACLSKYPFMLFAAHYTATEQKDLLEGYSELGKWPLRLFYLIHFSSMFIITAAVTLVTAGIVSFLTSLSVNISAGFILAFIALLLVIGNYSGLDFLMKIIISTLTVMTFIAVILALGIDKNTNLYAFDHPEIFTVSGLSFLVAFMGWMPIPLDASVWHSMWTTEKIKTLPLQDRKSNIVWDFKLGYVAASLIAVLFFLLGTLVLFGTGNNFADSSVVFVHQFVQLYASVFGQWSQYLVSIAALITMVSTTLAVADAYPRVSAKIIRRNFRIQATNEKSIYIASLLTIVLGAVAIIYVLPDSLGILVDFAAGLSFTTSPLLAYFNYRLVKKMQKKGKYHLSKGVEILSFVSLAILICITLIYLYNLVT